VTYYFGSRDDLLLATLQFAAAQDTAALSELAVELRPCHNSDQIADALSSYLVAQLATERVQLIAIFELALEAARNPRFVPTSRAWTAGALATVAPALRAAGSDTPERDATIILGAGYGLLFSELVAPTGDGNGVAIKEMMRTLLATFAERP
jgi:AcrR family transcriptional regulator